MDGAFSEWANQVELLHGITSLLLIGTNLTGGTVSESTFLLVYYHRVLFSEWANQAEVLPRMTSLLRIGTKLTAAHTGREAKWPHFPLILSFLLLLY